MYIIAHDLGTTGDKATLFSKEGELISSFTAPYETNWHLDIRAEQNPNDWLKAFKMATKEVMKGIDKNEVVGLSFSGQMMGCVCVDEAGSPLRPAIIWADMRATKEVDQLTQHIDLNQFYKITGHRLSPSYTLAKLLWVKENEAPIYSDTYKVLNPKDYLLYHLTGEFVTDYSDASGTNMFDINTMEWSSYICESAGVDIDLLPNLHASTDIVGYLNETLAEQMMLPVGLPIVCGGGDGVMAAVGARSVGDGDVFCTVGTSAWNAKTTLKPILDEDQQVFNWVHAVPGHYLPCGTMQTAGASLKWALESLEMDKIIGQVTSDGDIYKQLNYLLENRQTINKSLYFLPYLNGERSPRWNDEAKGAFVGMTISTDYLDMIQAVLEGVTMNLEIILRVLEQGNISPSIVMTGGAVRLESWQQLFANIYGLTIEIPKYLEEATSIGAAITAGVGIGVFDSFDVAKRFNPIEKTILPDKSQVEVYKKMKPIFDDIYHQLLPIYNKIS